MATIRTGLALHDQMTGVLKGVYSSINMTLRAMESLSDTMDEGFDPKQIRAARAAVQQAEAAIKALPPPIEDSERKQNKLNRSFKSGGDAAGELLGIVKKVAATVGTVIGVKKIVSLSDGIVETTARLDLMNDGLQTTAELQEKIFQSAQRSKAAYQPFADSIAALGMQAKDAFSSNEEIIAFMEQVNKTFAIAGTDSTGAASTMYNLTQALATGVLRGQDLNAVMSNAQPIVQNIADYMGVPVGHIRDMAAEGLITADVVKNAMFAAAEETNAKFEGMPLTFGQIMTTMKNAALMEFEPILMKINEIANSEKFDTFVANVTAGLAAIATTALSLFDTLMTIGNFIYDNWSVIEPILWGVVGAVVAWKIAQIALNVALTANPIGVIIMAVAALVGIIIAVTKYIINLWKTNDNFAAALMRAWNNILNFFDKVPIFFARAGIGIANVFRDIRVKALQIMENMINSIIDSINDLISLLNKIPGVSIEALGHVDISSKAALEAEAKRQAGEDFILDMEKSAAKKAAEREQKVLDMLDSRAAKRAQQAEEKAVESAIPEFMAYGDLDHIEKVDEVGKINDTVDISSEDLKTMRDLAEMKSIQNFVTLQPSFNVQTGDIHENADFDILIARLDQELQEALATTAEGLYNV